MKAVGKQFFFEKKNQKTFGSTLLWVANVSLWPQNKRVMPAQAGIHDFFFSVTKALDLAVARKSWMPACAGMTREGAGEGRNPFILDFNSKELLLPDV
jgi:hypothetical protein